jgi:glycosyltransferase involved in cell wall biosynthesis
VHHIGNGIDTSTYFFQNPKKVNSLRFITVGRISPSKKVDLLIDSLITHPSLKDSEWSLTIIGAGTNQAEDRYFNNIKKKVELSEFGKKIIFTGRLDSEQIIKYYRNSDFFFNLSSTGSIDKAILESMASGCLVISSNDSFKSIAVESGFSECIIDSDIHSIQNAISMFKAMNVDYLAKVAKRQSEVAISNHSLSGLVLRLSSILKKNSSAEN